MSLNKIEPAFIVDGKTFATKALANEYVKTPIIEAQVLKLAANDKDTAAWLLSKKEAILEAFGSTQIKRVTKQERKVLAKALDAVATAGGEATKFLVDNRDALLTSFRWPTVQRLSAEEKVAATKDAFLEVTEDNEAMADWLIANKDAIQAAFVVKQEVSEEQLAKLRAGAEKAREARNANKAAAEAAKPATTAKK